MSSDGKPCNRPALAAILFACSFILFGRAASAEAPGLTVKEGRLALNGKPFAGLGVNYFSLASRILQVPGDTSSLTNLSLLVRANIPFVRFMCGGFWPAEQRLYLTNRPEFFRRLDRVIRSAEQNRIGLIPSLFWNLATVSDLSNEPMQELGNTNSKSIAYIRNYTRDVVGRYRGSPAIWAWEFGNEASLSADLPNAAEHRPPVVVSLGTGSIRTERDELKSSQLHVALVEFGRAVRLLDQTRPILSGNALPRASAWHNTHETNWVSDSLAQFGEVLARDNPDPLDCISVHVYFGADFPAGIQSVSEMIAIAAREARQAGKPLFVGEFGVSRREGAIQEQAEKLSALLTALEKTTSPFGALWVFDFGEQDREWNVTFANDRARFLKLLGETNGRLGRLNN